MVTYNPKDWLKLILRFHKSDTFVILLPAILLLGAITGVISYIEQNHFHEFLPANLTIFHQISGFIISLVLVFRINSAYDRWWEGRKLWGSLLNNARNLSIKLNALIPNNDIEKRTQIQSLIRNYAFAVKDYLRGNTGYNEIEFSNELKKENFDIANHKPNYIAKQLTSYIINICKNNPQTPNDYLIVSENLNDFTDICGACERIKNTPIPYSYSIFIKKIVFIYIITMPISFGLTTGYWSIPIVMIMFYAFASLELISEEIEDPFGTDDNDLPTDEIAEKINVNTKEILLS
ncbi:MAG: bestrophin family protein [Bacteroidota bacterium]|nr:bestrophin family protein [Bacteroidota bacterium]MDP3147457.1 bestrophin family protein [Bacteroidota bacterium]MDP3557949.1 bestrophin family protein [Bacteroidota bacterium]